MLPINPDWEAYGKHLKPIGPSYTGAPGARDGVPPAYADAWARLQCQKPMAVSEAEWRQAIDDGGLWSSRKVAAWIAGELGLVSVAPQLGREMDDIVDVLEAWETKKIVA